MVNQFKVNYDKCLPIFQLLRPNVINILGVDCPQRDEFVSSLCDEGYSMVDAEKLETNLGKTIMSKARNPLIVIGPIPEEYEACKVFFYLMKVREHAKKYKISADDIMKMSTDCKKDFAALSEEDMFVVLV